MWRALPASNLWAKRGSKQARATVPHCAAVCYSRVHGWAPALCNAKAASTNSYDAKRRTFPSTTISARPATHFERVFKPAASAPPANTRGPHEPPPRRSLSPAVPWAPWLPPTRVHPSSTAPLPVLACLPALARSQLLGAGEMRGGVVGPGVGVAAPEPRPAFCCCCSCELEPPAPCSPAASRVANESCAATAAAMAASFASASAATSTCAHRQSARNAAAAPRSHPLERSVNSASDASRPCGVWCGAGGAAYGQEGQWGAAVIECVGKVDVLKHR